MPGPASSRSLIKPPKDIPIEWEMAAMRNIVRAFNVLPRKARRRLLDYLNSRYGGSQ